jgi:NAD(P)-dependent dehydrogenase (short-subunit alcohol dehydrogenase family)
MNIEGATIVVTGAGSGLGAATARHLARHCARILVLDRDGEAAAKVATEIAGTPAEADVTDESQLSTALDRAPGPLRAAVSCAGIGPAARIVGRDGPHDLDLFRRCIDVNLIGTFNVMRLAAARIAEAEPMEDGERGAIVNTASVAAFDGQIGQAAYAASKGAIVSLALPAAREFARIGIRVNTVAPGIFDTPLLASLGEEVRAGIAAVIPYPQRLGDPDEFAATVRYCLETRYLNAEVVRLDGGVRLPPK